jgi:hypothetical protein
LRSCQHRHCGHGRSDRYQKSRPVNLCAGRFDARLANALSRQAYPANPREMRLRNTFGSPHHLSFSPHRPFHTLHAPQTNIRVAQLCLLRSSQSRDAQEWSHLLGIAT